MTDQESASSHPKEYVMNTVTGIFERKADANSALSELLDAGFTKSDISLIVSDKARNTIFGPTEDETSRAAKGGATGAALGGAAGAIIAGLTATGSLLVPGANLLMVGPIVAILSGAGAGAAVGGLTGALINAGIPESEAGRYESELTAGKAIIIVHAANAAKADMARSILQSTGAMTRAA